MIRFIPVVLIVALAACSKGGSPQSESATATSQTGTPSADGSGTTPAVEGTQPTGSGSDTARGTSIKPVPAELPVVLARVNGEEVKKADFEKAVKNLEGRAGGPVPSTERDRIYRDVLNELIGYKLLLQESQNRKVAVTDADVDTRLASIRQQFPSEEMFQKMLAQQNLTVEQVRSEMKNELRVTKLLESEIAPKVSVSASDVSAFYQQNPKEFQVPEQVRASHILIAVPAGSDASTKAAALAKATTVLKSARAGKDFAALAKEHSQDPGSAANGGDLGQFAPGQMVGPFSDVAFKLAPGSISDVVETDFGYHIIKVMEKQAERPVPLDEARPKIEQHLENEVRRKHTEAFVQGLAAKGKVDVYF